MPKQCVQVCADRDTAVIAKTSEGMVVKVSGGREQMSQAHLAGRWPFPGSRLGDAIEEL